MNKLSSLKSNIEFRNLLKLNKINNNYFTIYFGKIYDQSQTKLKISFVTKKKIGNAVIRNKCKRKLRVLAKDILSKYAKKNSDYVLIARNTTYNRNISLLKTDLLNALKETKYIKKI